jgi:hypothetical protein
MPVKKPDLTFQNNSLGESKAGKRELTKEEEQQLIDVQNTLSSPGYLILHQLFLDTAKSAEIELANMQNSIDVLRYYQGVIGCIQRVQGKFIALSKEETYAKK